MKGRHPLTASEFIHIMVFQAISINVVMSQKALLAFYHVSIEPACSIPDRHLAALGTPLTTDLNISVRSDPTLQCLMEP